MDSVDVTTFPETEGAPMRRLTGGRDPDGAEPDGSEAAMSPKQVKASGDERCAECGAPLASDQRYCVECGERRGERRFPAALQPAPTPPASAPPAPAGQRSRMSSSTTLIAGVGTLLLAMGVGVLIGRSGSSSSGHAAGVSVVTVGSATGAAAGTTTGTSGTTAGATAGAAKASTAKASSNKAIKPPKKSQLPPPTVTVGSKGSGKGYKNGRFTGEFFGTGE
jgi:hypothetical protein